ncbi:hypothetical protein PLESTM_000454600 [Pleodorina starrii]|nr:hypothetical protein PLESTM_000454600 [Pleodorina starrii]
MILFACTSPPPSPPTDAPAVFPCAESGGGPNCSTFYLGWAPGQDERNFPLTVGLPIGESDSTYFSLQVHYNNPNGVSGRVDDSGFTLLYTPKLRQYDAAVLTVGQRAITIPPGAPDFRLQPNVCPSTCTSRLRAPLRLLYSGLHMHTLGRSIVTQHIRNGTELPPVGSKQFYDYNFQSVNPVPLDSSLLLPGDVLVTTCSYDSTSRTNVTKFGEGTADEMCFNFITYYPRDPGFTACMSLDTMAADPRVAFCGNSTTARRVSAAFAELRSVANATRSTRVAAGGNGSVSAAGSSGLSAVAANLSAEPALAPLFRSGALGVALPSNGTDLDG